MESSSSSTTFQQLFDRLPSNGWLTESEARLLWDNASGTILEVGSYYGRSTVLLAHRGKVISVDPFDHFDSDDPSGNKIYERFLENVAGLPVENYKMRIEEWGYEPVDFAFLDGDHTYKGTINQIQKALECNPKIIAIHDFSNSHGGILVQSAAIELLGEPHELVETMALWRRK